MLTQIKILTEHLDAAIKSTEKLDPLKTSRPTDPDKNVAYSTVLATLRAWKREIQPIKEPYETPTCRDGGHLTEAA